MAIDWGSIAQIGANLASNYVASRQAARQQEQQNQQLQNQQAIQQNAQQNNLALQLALLDLQRREMAERNRSTRARQAALGDLQANVQDARIGGLSHIPRLSLSGGLRPSALGPNARAAGQVMSRDALMAMLRGDSFSPVRTAGPIDVSANMPQEGLLDKILGGIGTAGNLWQAYQAAQNPPTVTTGASTPQAAPPGGSLWDRFISNTGSGMQMPGSTRFGR